MTSFVERIGEAWLQAAGFALGAAAACTSTNQELLEWRRRRDRCFDQGNLVLDLAREEPADPILREAS